MINKKDISYIGIEVDYRLRITEGDYRKIYAVFADRGIVGIANVSGSYEIVSCDAMIFKTSSQKNISLHLKLVEINRQASISPPVIVLPNPY